MIDTHCHLTFPDFAGRVPQVLERAQAAGVTGAITISTTTQDCPLARATAHAHQNVWFSAGVHPLYADKGPHDWAGLAAAADDPRCVAWGELGLDNHYAEPAREVQLRVLGEELGLIESHRGRPLPIVLHCRKAFDDLIPILRRTRLDPTRFVFHCFTGTAAEARKVLDFGAMISFTGVVTYHNAGEVQEAVRLTPRDRIMVETDAPFLSPHPHRGTRPCEPWMASVTARFLADLRGESWDDFSRAIDANTARFFGIPA